MPTTCHPHCIVTSTPSATRRNCTRPIEASLSAENIQSCEKAGVIQVSIPQRGGHKTAEQDALERSKEFKKGQRFRAGIEGRISVLFRGRGMKRCPFKGRTHFELLVGAAVLANNLMRIADLLNNNRRIARPRAA